MEVPYKGDSFAGIMSTFYKKSKNTFYSKFEAEGEKYAAHWANPSDVFDPTKHTWWASKPIDNANLTISFKKHLLKISDYTFLPRFDSTENMPRGWKLEASNDKTNWHLLHSVNDCEDVKIANAYKTYPCKPHGAFKYFRITQTQMNWNEGFIFHISRLEFFGTIFGSMNPFIKHTCVAKTKGINHILLICLIVSK